MSKAKRNRPTRYEKSLTRPPRRSLIEFYISGVWIYRNSALETTLHSRIRREGTPLLEEMIVEFSAAGVSDEGFSRPKLQNFMRERAAHRLEEKWSSEGWWPPRIGVSARDERPERWDKYLCQEVITAFGEMEGIASATDIAKILNAGAPSGADLFDRDIVRSARETYLTRTLPYRLRGAPDLERQMRRSMQESVTLLRSLRLVEWYSQAHGLRMHGADLAIELDERFGLAFCVDGAAEFIAVCDARGLSELDEDSHRIAYREQRIAEIRACIAKRDALGIPW